VGEVDDGQVEQAHEVVVDVDLGRRVGDLLLDGGHLPHDLFRLLPFLGREVVEGEVVAVHHGLAVVGGGIDGAFAPRGPQCAHGRACLPGVLLRAVRRKRVVGVPGSVWRATLVL
jgi:hypothetical protein